MTKTALCSGEAAAESSEVTYAEVTKKKRKNGIFYKNDNKLNIKIFLGRVSFE